jgi:hypothetical protein
LWIQIRVLNKVTMLITLQNHLSDTITLLNMKRAISVIEKNDPNFTLIVPVDDTGAHLDTVFDGQTRATGDAGIASLGNLHANPSGNHEPLALMDNAVRAGIEIIARGKFCAPCR